jgi:Tol biopolymer transport system component
MAHKTGRKRGLLILAAGTITVGCGSVTGRSADGGGNGSGGALVASGTGGAMDASTEASVATGAGGASAAGGQPGCDLAAPFVSITPLVSLNAPSSSTDALSLSPDGSVAWFSTSRPGGLGAFDIWTAVDDGGAGNFGAATPVAAVNSSNGDRTPRISADGLTLFFRSNRGGKGWDILVATRATTLATFSAPIALANVNTDSTETDPFVVAGGDAIYFTSDRPGGVGATDIYFAVQTASGSFGSPQLVPGAVVDTAAAEGAPVLSRDGLSLYFASDRGTTGLDIYLARRTTTAEPFNSLVAVSELNDADDETPTEISPDGCVLYFDSNRGGKDGGAAVQNLYVARRSP